MNKFIIVVVASCAILFTGATDPVDQTIRWMSWEEAAKLNETTPKKVFVDIYTDWCGWCKRMDATTFQDADVVDYVNKYFYAVKFNAEQKENIKFRNQDYKWVQAGRRGIHTLAYSLLEGRMSYPTFVTLNEKYERIAIMPGYKKPDQLMKELKFAAEEVYKETSWKEYSGGSD